MIESKKAAPTTSLGQKNATLIAVVTKLHHFYSLRRFSFDLHLPPQHWKKPVQYIFTPVQSQASQLG